MKVLPILLGGDLNCYSMALAFFEAGCPRSVALGKYRLGVTSFSKLVRVRTDPNMGNDEGRIKLIREVASASPDCRAILVGCTDEYASFLIRKAEILGSKFIIPSPTPSALEYADKAVFASVCGQHGILTPETVVLSVDDAFPNDLPFSYPIVLKPSVSEEYWKNPFSGMRKVWFLRNRSEAVAICEKIKRSGYSGRLVLQRKLEISDSDNYVLTTYSDRFGRVCAMAYGRVLLEEHTPRGLGNHAAILTQRAPLACRKIVDFLDSVGYCGFANFDLVRDPIEERLYTLEMNLRQGRSNHYMTASGLNPAALVIADRVLEQKMEFAEASADIFWHSVPRGVIYSRLKDEALCRRLRDLADGGRAISPFHIREDLSKNPLRRLFVAEHERRIKKRAATVMAE